VIVVQYQDGFLFQLVQTIDQERQDPFSVGRFGGLQQWLAVGRQPGLQIIEGCGKVMKEPGQVIVFGRQGKPSNLGG
jgi:hypothetical protein